MATVIARSGQTFADIAVQEYGSFEAAIDLALANGMSVTDNIPGGSELSLVDKTYNKVIQDYCKNNSVSPSSILMSADGGTRLFAEQFSIIFD